MNNNHVNKYTYFKNIKLIEYDNSSVLIKKKKRYDIESVYKYLDDHNVNTYLRPFKIKDDLLYFNYIKKKEFPADEVAKRLVHALSNLQHKTTYYKALDKDKLKESYESFNDNIKYLKNYYLSLQDLVEDKVFMTPSEYLFIRNVSLIYSALNYTETLVKSWYEIKKGKTNERISYVHGKCELDHFLIGDNDFFISLEKAHCGSVVEDFIYFYNKNCFDVDMISNFKYYQQRYPFEEDEYLYFLINITMPKKIDIYKSSLDKCCDLVDFFDKLKLTSDFILKNNKEKKYEKKN